MDFDNAWDSVTYLILKDLLQELLAFGVYVLASRKDVPMCHALILVCDIHVQEDAAKLRGMCGGSIVLLASVDHDLICTGAICSRV